ncbi:MAG: hypothetical protein R6V25_08570 [Desulfatiglandales bacterium]
MKNITLRLPEKGNDSIAPMLVKGASPDFAGTPNPVSLSTDSFPGHGAGLD